MSRQIQKCPCELLTEECKDKRDIAVNVVLQRGFCSANELKTVLSDEGLGKSATRKSLNFLNAKKCPVVAVLEGFENKRKLQFKGQGRVYYRTDLPRMRLYEIIVALLTPLQRDILDKLSKQHKNIYYFSIYELKKLLPFTGASINSAVSKLAELDLVKLIEVDRIRFYTKPENVERLNGDIRKAIIDDKAEYEVIKRIHELVMNLYPLHWIKNLKGAIRPATTEVLKVTGGMTFDIFYEFNEPAGEKRYLAVDVYTRIPVNGYVVNSFLKKIEWSGTGKHTGASAGRLGGRTFGMIVYRNANQMAINIANRRGIRFIHPSRIKIDYGDIYRRLSKEVLPEPPVVLPEDIEKLLSGSKT